MSERKTANEPTEKRGRVNEQKKKEKKEKMCMWQKAREPERVGGKGNLF